MASGRVGGARAKVRGQVGDLIYQVVRNDDGSYSQEVYAKAESKQEKAYLINHYLESFPDEQPFLIELVIHQDVKRELATTLHRLGLERYRIYPELDQLKYQVRWEQGGKR